MGVVKLNRKCGVYSRVAFIFFMLLIGAAFIRGRRLIEEIRYMPFVGKGRARTHIYMPFAGRELKKQELIHFMRKNSNSDVLLVVMPYLQDHVVLVLSCTVVT